MTVNYIHQSQLAPMASVGGIEHTKLSAFELDAQLVEAFETLDLSRAQELVKQGANPDQTVTVNFKIVLEFLKLNLFNGTEENTKMDWDAILAQLESEGDINALVNDFFGGQATHSVLFLSLILKDENLALTLIENHANLIITYEKPEGYTANALQMASGMNAPKVVEYLLQNTSFASHLPEQEGDLSPIEIALSAGAFDVFKVIVENRKNEVMKLLIEKDAIRQVITDSTDPSVEPYRQLLIDHGFPITAPNAE